MIGDLGHRRAELESALVDIVLESFVIENRHIVADNVLFRDPEGKIELLWSDAEELLGFVSTSWDRFELEGQRHSILDMGMYVRPGLRKLGAIASQRVVLELMRERLRHPFRRASYVGEMVSPASYRQALRVWPEVHPRRDVAVPPAAQRLLTEVSSRRGFEAIDGDPWRVRLPLPIAFRNLERMDRYIREVNDLDVDFFVARNPGYARGHWLAIWVPFDLANVAGACSKLLRR